MPVQEKKRRTLPLPQIRKLRNPNAVPAIRSIRKILPQNYVSFIVISFFHFSFLQALPVIDSMIGNVFTRVEDKEMILEAEDNAIINFSSFEIEKNEKLTIEMQDPSHRILLKCDSEEGSEIRGMIVSNGILYLQDPEKISFYRGSFVQAKSLFVTAAHLTDKNFLLKSDSFGCVSGKIDIFEGVLQADQICLVGRTIDQEGTLISNGNIIIVPSLLSEIVLSRQRSETPQFIPSERRKWQDDFEIFLQPQQTRNCPITELFFFFHTGKTVGKNIYIYGRNLTKMIISGTLEVNTDKEGEKGGEISIQGSIIEFDGAELLSCGPSGGGNIFIGGGDRRAFFPIPKTLVFNGLRIYSCATKFGDGGRVTIRSKSTFPSHLEIYVKSGPHGGQEGSVETLIGEW